MGELVVFLAIVVAVAVAGVRLGMLVAPRLGRLAEAGDEDPEPDADSEPDADPGPDEDAPSLPPTPEMEPRDDT